jgi:hypothetical protein
VAQLYDTSTLELVEIPDADAPSAILSGRYGLDASRNVILHGPDGETYKMPATSAPEAFEKGYTFIPQGELRAKESEEKYGALGAKLLAGGAGVLRGPTFGLSDRVMRNAGVEARTLTDLQEGFPVISTAGEVIGDIGAVALTGGASALGQGAVKAAGLAGAKGLLKKAGAKALEFGVTGAVEGAAFGAGHAVSEDALGRADLNAESLIANMGLGAAFGGGAGALLGGGGTLTVASVSAAASAAKTGVKKIGDIASKLYLKAVSAAGGDADAVAKAVAEPFTPQGMAIRKELFTDPESRDLIAKQLQGGINDVLAVTDDITRQAKGARTEETARLVGGQSTETATSAASDLLGGAKQLLGELRNEPDIYSAKGAIRQFEKLVDGFEKKLIDGGVESTEDAFRLVDDFKGAIDAQVSKFGRNISASEKETIDRLRDFRKTVKLGLEDESVYGAAGSRQRDYNSAVSEFLTAQKEFFRKFGEKVPTKGGGQKYQLSPVKVNTLLNQIGAQRAVSREAALDVFLTASKRLIAEADVSLKNAGVEFSREAADASVDAVTSQKARAAKALEQISKLRALDNGLAFLDLARGGGIKLPLASSAIESVAPSRAARTLYRIEKATAAVRGRVDQAVGGFVRRASRAGQVIERGAGAAGKARTPITHALMEHVFNPSAAIDSRKVASRKDAAKQRSRELSELLSDPVKVANRVAVALHGLEEAAPGISGQAALTATKALQFLHTRAPKNPQSMNTAQPLLDDWQPTDQEVSRFERYMRAAFDPMTVLDDLASGTLTKEGVETLKELYPQLHQMTVAKLSEKITTLKERLPYSDRVSLSLLLGVPTDDSMRPQFISRTQKMWAQKPNQGDGAGGQRIASLGKLGLGENMRSNTQALEVKR